MPCSVLRDPAAELRELQDQRVVQRALVAQVVVERRHPVAVGAHQVAVAAGAAGALLRMRVEAARLHPEDTRAVPRRRPATVRSASAKPLLG